MGPPRTIQLSNSAHGNNSAYLHYIPALIIIIIIIPSSLVGDYCYYVYDTVVAKSIYFVGKWYQRAFFRVVHTRCMFVGLSTGIWHSFNIRSLVAGSGGRDRAMHRRLLFLLGSALDFISKHIGAGAHT